MRFRDAVCKQLQMKLTMIDAGLTTCISGLQNQKERTLHLMLRLRGETEHANDNVTSKGASAW